MVIPQYILPQAVTANTMFPAVHNHYDVLLSKSFIISTTSSVFIYNNLSSFTLKN